MNDGSSGETCGEAGGKNKPEGGGSRESCREAARDAENELPEGKPWYQKTRGRMWSCAKSILNPIVITFIILLIIIAIVKYWYYVRPKWYKKIYEKLLQFQGFKYSHLTNQEIEASENCGASQQLAPRIGITNSLF